MNPKALQSKPSPARRAAASARDSITYALAPSSLGLILAAWRPGGLCALFIGDEPEPLVADLRRRYPAAEIREADGDGDGDDPRLAQLLAFVESPGRPAPTLEVSGSPFQREVWNGLLQIPYGTAITYAELARRIGRPSSVRAVGHACGANPVSIVIPCHRVVASDGRLTGYRWGIGRKRELLQREGVMPPGEDLRLR